MCVYIYIIYQNAKMVKKQNDVIRYQIRRVPY